MRAVRLAVYLVSLVIFVSTGIGNGAALAQAGVSGSAALDEPTPMATPQPTATAISVILERPIRLLVIGETPVYFPDGQLAWLAQPGERYRTVLLDNGWAMAVGEGDPPEFAVWLQLDDRVLVEGSAEQ